MNQIARNEANQTSRDELLGLSPEQMRQLLLTGTAGASGFVEVDFEVLTRAAEPAPRAKERLGQKRVRLSNLARALHRWRI